MQGSQGKIQWLKVEQNALATQASGLDCELKRTPENVLMSYEKILAFLDPYLKTAK
jgi:hypothetical protein